MEELTSSISVALQQTGQMIGDLQKDIDDLVNRLQETEKCVNSLTEPVKEPHTALLRTFEHLKDRVKNDFELSVA
jgi:hypothetical protein